MNSCCPPSKAVLLVIGDSLTASGEHTAWLLDNAKNDSMGLRLIGTRGQSSTNRHEGRGGWTVSETNAHAHAHLLHNAVHQSSKPVVDLGCGHE
jgi:hypothetical protein